MDVNDDECIVVNDDGCGFKMWRLTSSIPVYMCDSLFCELVS